MAEPETQVGGPPASRFAVVGTLLWIGWMALEDPGMVEALVGLSPAVLHPLVVRLATGTDSPAGVLARGLRWAQLPAAAALLWALGRGPGSLVGLWSLPWLGVTIWTAAVGVSRARAHGFRPVPELSIDAGLAMIAVGGLWAAASCLGLRPLEFSDTIVLLTAAHFHYAGFVLPVLAGIAARRAERGLGFMVPLGAIIGVPFTAVGITLSAHVEVLASFVVALSGAGLAVLQLDVARGLQHRIAAMLLGVSSLALLYGMFLATSYAVTEFRGAPWPSIPEMAQWHGMTNALGFALVGTWGWLLAENR